MKRLIAFFVFVASLCAMNASANNSFIPSWNQNPTQISQEYDIPFPPMLLQAIVLRLQNMGNPEGEEAAKMIDYAVAGLGLKRLSVKESEWIYGKDVSISEEDGETVCELKSPDAFALNVYNTHIASAELVFKNKKWLQTYKDAIEALDYSEVLYLQGKDGKYMRPGSHNYFFIEEDDIINVSFNSKYFEEPTELSPYDVVSALGQPSQDLRELAGYREYVTAGSPLTKTEGNTKEWYLSQGCKLSLDSKGVLQVIRNPENQYNPMSYINIVEKDDVITDLLYVSYGGNDREFVEALIALRFTPMEDTRMEPVDFNSGYAMSFKDPDEAKADLRLDKDGNVYLQMSK